jgi:hypothetical protein
MKFLKLTLLLVIYLSFGFSHLSFASSLSGNDLVSHAGLYNGWIVTFEGEVIGDIMARGDHAWLNVNDGERAIGIWASLAMIRQIKISGDYNHIGDIIEVTGQFNRACSEHGGDLDIHAREIKLIKRGRKVQHPVDPFKMTIGFGLLALTAGVHLFIVIRKRLKT